MRALLIRHGQTRGNAAEEFIGSTDEPLSPEGREAAERAKKDPALKKVFVSPMLRARQTASILFPNAGQIVIPDLREMDFGQFERRRVADMQKDPRYVAWSDCAGMEGPPGGESRPDVAARRPSIFPPVSPRSALITRHRRLTARFFHVFNSFPVEKAASCGYTIS